MTEFVSILRCPVAAAAPACIEEQCACWLCLLLAEVSSASVLHCTLAPRAAQKLVCPSCLLLMYAGRTSNTTYNDQYQMHDLCLIVASSPALVSAATISATRSSRARNPFMAAGRAWCSLLSTTPVNTHCCKSDDSTNQSSKVMVVVSGGAEWDVCSCEGLHVQLVGGAMCVVCGFKTISTRGGHPC